jgi:PPM family protein phosphatase
LQIKSSGMTDVGLQREGNEDSFSVQDAFGLYMVADGMGGHQAGEVASRVAVEMINESFSKWSKDHVPPDEIFGFPDESLSREGNYILGSIRLANRVIYEMACEYEKYNGMGTTIVSLLVGSGLIVAANVGDSRMYLVRDNRIERMSKDHTIVAEHAEMGVMTEEEAARSPLRHILTRSLGSSENVDAEVFEIEPSSEDRFILCSDGLTDLATDEEILKVALKETDPQYHCGYSLPGSGGKEARNILWDAGGPRGRHLKWSGPNQEEVRALDSFDVAILMKIRIKYRHMCFNIG